MLIDTAHNYIYMNNILLIMKMLSAWRAEERINGAAALYIHLTSVGEIGIH